MPKFKLKAKRAYVASVRGLGAVLRAVGVLGWLERRQDRRGYHWVRSLFAIHDIDQMIALDVPWWTYRAIDRVDAFLRARPDASVFEYGSGASTIWLARRAGAVHSVEHDMSWFDLMQSRIAPYPHIRLSLAPADNAPSAHLLYHSQKEEHAGESFENYVAAITLTGQTYDLIVIDGRARGACLRVAQQCLSDGGMIVFDNTKRKRYAAAIAQSGLVAIDLPGLTPSLPYPDKTTLLYGRQTAAPHV